MRSLQMHAASLLPYMSYVDNESRKELCSCRLSVVCKASS